MSNAPRITLVMRHYKVPAIISLIGVLCLAALAGLGSWLEYTNSPEGRAARQAEQEAQLEERVAVVAGSATWLPGINSVHLAPSEFCEPLKEELAIANEAFKQVAPQGAIPISVDIMHDRRCYAGMTVTYIPIP